MYTETDPAQYKLLNSDNRMVKQVLESNNVSLASEDSNNWSVLWSCNGLNQKPQIYDNMQEYQKVNHFLNSTEITRKDRLTSNFMKMRSKWGPEEFNYLPESYVLPDQVQEFKQAFLANQQ